MKVIPRTVAAAIARACPDAELLWYRDDSFVGLGLKHHGKQIAWKFNSTPDNWREAEQAALAWLEKN